VRCSVDEQDLFSLCDGLLDGKEQAALIAHYASCPRCKGVYEEARRSLSILNRPAPENLYLSPEKERSIIAAALEPVPAQEKPRIIPFPRKGFLYAALAALVIFSVVSGILLLSSPDADNRKILSSTVPCRQPGRVAESTQDTTIMFNDMCVLRVVAGADVCVRQTRPRAIHFILAHGTILIAAHKGLYDSIAVECPSVKVIATGTHFSVSKNDSSVSVSVLEGTVKLLSSRATDVTPEFVLSSLEICSARDSDTASQWNKEEMTAGVRNQLVENFRAMGCSDDAAHPSPGPSTVFDDSEDFPHKALRSVTTGVYGEIRKLIRKRDYDKAIARITAYLTTHPHDPDKAYCDLALCYCKTNQWDKAISAYGKAASMTNDRLVREAILHRTNHILFSKLFRYDEAEKGIRSYLALYPNGVWREREQSLLARVEDVRKRRQ
jgi:FecR protein/Anaphase-promoting complex, cyclosome, subunit 3/Putative zinc-finger